MGLLNQYLQIKNKIKFNDAIMDGIAKAISNGVEQNVSQQLHLHQNNSTNDEKKLVNNTVIDTEAHYVNVSYQATPEQIIREKPAKKSFKELKESVKVYSNDNNKGVYDLNLGRVSAEPTNEQYLRVRECITKIILHYLEEDRETKLRHQLFIDSNDERFTAVLYLTLYFLIRSSIMKMKSQGEYIEDTVLALDNAILELPQIGQWIVDASKKYSSSSEILNNPESDAIIEFLYENSMFNGASDKNIYVALLNFRNDVVSYAIDTLKKDLSDLYLDLKKKELEKKQCEKEKREREKRRLEEIDQRHEQWEKEQQIIRERENRIEQSYKIWGAFFFILLITIIVVFAK